MSKSSETGDAKNIANFEKLIAYVQAFGAQYNPANPRLQLTALQAKLDESKNILQQKNHGFNELKAAIVEKNIPFTQFSDKVTRMTAAVNASGLSEQTVKNAKFYVRVLRGERAKAKETSEPATDATGPLGQAEQPTLAKTISVSHLSHVYKAENLSKYVDMLAMETNYATNEADLSIQALQLYVEDLKSKINGVDSKSAAISVINASCNEILYHPETGTVNIGLQVKAYVLSSVGTKSQLYKDVKKISFRTIKK